MQKNSTSPIYIISHFSISLEHYICLFYQKNLRLSLHFPTNKYHFINLVIVCSDISNISSLISTIFCYYCQFVSIFCDIFAVIYLCEYIIHCETVFFCVTKYIRGFRILSPPFDTFVFQSSLYLR